MLGAQLDLFGDRHLRLEGARRALAECRTAEACNELALLQRIYPSDPRIAEELDAARELASWLAEIEAMRAADRPRWLVELAERAPSSLRTALLRRAAVELRDTAGPAALLDDKAPSVLLLRAGDVHTAWATAAEAVRDSPRARFLAYLGDAEHRLEQWGRARSRYREALAIDPGDVDWDELADDDVAALPDIARSELELDDGLAWSGPVGVVLGVLPLGEPPPLGAADADPGRPLARARAFLRALIGASREHGAGALAARKQMRALSPELLAAYLETR